MMPDAQAMKALAVQREVRRQAQGITPAAVDAAIAAERRRWEAKSRLGRWIEWRGRVLAALWRKWRGES